MPALLLGDSLLRPVYAELKEYSDFKVVFQQGATIDSLTDTLLTPEKFCSRLWQDIDFVWILVGTNDIGNCFRYNKPFNIGQFIDGYRHMLLTILSYNRNIHIVSAGVVPRLCDYKESKPMVNTANKRLGKLCQKLNIEFKPIVSTFCFQGIPQEQFFRPDRLHLSRRGALVLKKEMQRCYHRFRCH